MVYLKWLYHVIFVVKKGGLKPHNTETKYANKYPSNKKVTSAGFGRTKL